jgi:hypothetical protein
MIAKLLILVDNKLVLNKFTIGKQFSSSGTSKIVIKSVDCPNYIIKVPVYNKINGIDYYPVVFPLELPIYNKNVFNPYIILSSYNLNFPNDIDFFSQINQIMETNFGLKFFNFDNLINDSNLFSKIINEHYINLINFEILNTITDFKEFIKYIWLCININKLFTIHTLIKNTNITNKNIKEISNKLNLPKKLFTIPNQMKLIKYNITLEPTDYNMNFLEYYSWNFKSSLKLSDIKPNEGYYIIVNKSDSGSTITTEIVSNNENNVSKVIKIHVSKVNKNIIGVSPTKNIIFENYKWYYYHPNLMIDSQYVTFQTFINQTFTKDIIKNGLNLEDQHIFKILDYYMIDDKKSNLMALNLVFDNFKEYLSDLNILKLNSFSDGFFDYVTRKYSTPGDSKIFDILSILFENYNYPLKNNRHEFDQLFDYILYFSLYNYKSIWIQNKFSNNTSASSDGLSKYNNIDMLHPNINSSIPIKLKNLYVNLMKVMSQVINDEYEAITYNQKFYSDYLHKNIIKILLSDNGSQTNLSVSLFKNLLKPTSFDKLKTIVQTNLLLIDIGNKLSWNSLPKKLNYLNIFYKNDTIVHYQDKLNKNIIPDHFDFRIKKIIENPFEMYKYLRKEKDFVKWTKFISDRVIQLYLIPISLSSEDFNHIGKLIYLLFNINEQNTKDESYISFINFCNLNNKLVLESNRINLKIREYFPTLKCNLNLGFLAKHLTWDKETITFDDNHADKSTDVLALKMKLQIATKKYYKYKAKYLESKDIGVDSIVKYEDGYQIDKNKLNISETSSVKPILNTNKFFS